jgi:hypothetical protein
MARASARTSIPLDETAATGTFAAFAQRVGFIAFIARRTGPIWLAWNTPRYPTAHIEELGPSFLRCGISAGITRSPAIISGVNSL